MPFASSGTEVTPRPSTSALPPSTSSNAFVNAPWRHIGLSRESSDLLEDVKIETLSILKAFRRSLASGPASPVECASKNSNTLPRSAVARTFCEISSAEIAVAFTAADVLMSTP